MKTINTDTAPQQNYLQAFRGHFIGIMQWDQLDIFWQTLENKADAGWYIYTIGEQPPSVVCNAASVVEFVREVDALIRMKHHEEYCGIVYTDNKSDPELVKIYNPGNLGVVCGFSDHPPLPGWVMSIIPPVELNANSFLPANRQRWWQRIWKKAS